MFWFLRRTGATSFLNSFNSNTSKVASKSEKHVSGAYQICISFYGLSREEKRRRVGTNNFKFVEEFVRFMYTEHSMSSP